MPSSSASRDSSTATCAVTICALTICDSADRKRDWSKASTFMSAILFARAWLEGVASQLQEKDGGASQWCAQNDGNLYEVDQETCEEFRLELNSSQQRGRIVDEIIAAAVRAWGGVGSSGFLGWMVG